MLDNEEGQPFKTPQRLARFANLGGKHPEKCWDEERFSFFISAEESRSFSVLQHVKSSQNPIFHGQKTSLEGNYTLKKWHKTIALNTVCYSLHIFIPSCKPFSDFTFMGCILFRHMFTFWKKGRMNVDFNPIFALRNWQLLTKVSLYRAALAFWIHIWRWELVC